MVFTCAILHNMLLEYDGRDQLWSTDVVWEGVDGEHEVGDEEGDWVNRGFEVIHRRALRRLDDFSHLGHRDHNVEEQVRGASEPEFYTLRKKLIEHYFYKWQHRRNELEWLN